MLRVIAIILVRFPARSRAVLKEAAASRPKKPGVVPPAPLKPLQNRLLDVYTKTAGRDEIPAG
jgi:hypothetical protein